jgi:DNA-binding transcriptional LysR family regulator
LTELGKVFAREARIVLEQAQVAQRVARDFNRGLTGHLRVAYVGSSGYAIIPGAIQSFRKAYPNARISVESILGHRQVEALRTGGTDVALHRGPVDGAGLRIEQLRSDRFLLVLPVDHRLSGRKRVPLKELVEENFIALASSPQGGTPDIVRTISANAGFFPHVILEVDTYAVLVSCVGKGMGIAIASESVRSFSVAGVTYRDLQPEPATVDLLALARSNDTNPLIPVFIEHLHMAAKSAY